VVGKTADVGVSDTSVIVPSDGQRLLEHLAGSLAKTVSVTVGRHRTCTISPRRLYCVTGSRRDIVLADRTQLPSNQPVHRDLRRALRYANRFRQFQIAHLHRPISSSLFGIEPEIQEKAGRSPVMTNQVAHQNVDHVIVKREHAIPIINIASDTTLQRGLYNAMLRESKGDQRWFEGSSS